MNIIMTTSGYILRLRDLISNKISDLVNPNHAVPAMAAARNSTFTEENALHMLLDQGKTFHEAQLVITTMKEWGLPIEHVAILDFEVHGNSVWIKPD